MGAWPTRRSRALDIFLAVTLASGDAVFLWFTDQRFWLPPSVVSACSVVLGLALVVRRVHPVGLALFSLVFGTVTGAGVFAALVVLYSLAAYTSSRRTVLTIAVATYIAGLAFPSPTATTDNFAVQAIFGIAFIAVPVLLGLYMGAATAPRIAPGARGEARTRTAPSRRARAGEERTRIAREMHDVVANRISVMVVHSGALKAIASRDPVRAAETAAVIGDM